MIQRGGSYEYRKNAVLEQNFVPVVDSRNTLCGIVTRRRLIAYYAGREIPLE